MDGWIGHFATDFATAFATDFATDFAMGFERDFAMDFATDFATDFAMDFAMDFGPRPWPGHGFLGLGGPGPATYTTPNERVLPNSRVTAPGRGYVSSVIAQSCRQK